jgi:hypothetical protein
MPRPSHPPRLHYSNNTWRRVQIMKLFVMQFSPFSCHLISHINICCFLNYDLFRFRFNAFNLSVTKKNMADKHVPLGTTEAAHSYQRAGREHILTTLKTTFYENKYLQLSGMDTPVAPFINLFRKLHNDLLHIFRRSISALSEQMALQE